jgi:lipopolysaccharide export system protein LptC
MSSRGIELTLPDLPEVPIRLGPASGPPSDGPGPRPESRWLDRLRDALETSLPLLLMAALALGSWWLVRQVPKPPAAREAGAARSDPDYTMRRFTVQRYAADGRLKLRIDGRELRHLPDVDRLDIDDVTIRAYAPDGREALAVARQARARGDGSEVELLGGAKVTGRAPDGTPVEIESEFLHLFIKAERVSTPRPVRVRHGASQVNAGGLEYDQRSGRLELQGAMRAVFAGDRVAATPQPSER